MSTTQTTKIISNQPSSGGGNGSILILTIIFTLLALTSIILSFLVFFDVIVIESDNSKEGYCPSKDCDISANNIKGAILSVNELKNVDHLFVYEDFSINTLSSYSLKIQKGNFLNFKNSQLTFSEGFSVDGGITYFTNSEKHNKTNISATELITTNASFTNFTFNNINCNILSNTTITTNNYNCINVSFLNISSTNIKPSENLFTKDLKCSNLFYSENSPSIQNLTVSSLKCNNILIKRDANINNFFTNLNISITDLNYSSSQPNIYLSNISGNLVSFTKNSTVFSKNITTINCNAVSDDTSSVFIIAPYIECNSATIKNLSISNITAMNGIFNRITATNFTVTNTLQGNVLSFPPNVNAYTLKCDNYTNFTYSNSQITATNVIYNKISIENNLNNSLKSYDCNKYNTDSKINLFGLNIDLIENIIDKSTYKYVHTIYIDGNYTEPNDININISYTNINNNLSFNPSTLIGTSFKLYINKNINNPTNNNVYIKINNLFPVNMNLYGLGNVISIDSKKSLKFLIASQENIISTYNFTCLSFKNNLITYFISV